MLHTHLSTQSSGQKDGEFVSTGLKFGFEYPKGLVLPVLPSLTETVQYKDQYIPSIINLTCSYRGEGSTILWTMKRL